MNANQYGCSITHTQRWRSFPWRQTEARLDSRALASIRGHSSAWSRFACLPELPPIGASNPKRSLAQLLAHQPMKSVGPGVKATAVKLASAWRRARMLLMSWVDWVQGLIARAVLL